MKKTYSKLVDEVLQPGITSAQQKQMYTDYPQYAQKLQSIVKTTKQLKQFGKILPDSEANFALVLEQLTDNPAVAHQTNESSRSFMWRFGYLVKIGAPVAVFALVVLVGVNLIQQSGQQNGSSTNQDLSASIPNGSVGHANTAMLQDNTSEKVIATAGDGTVDIYTASAANLVKLEESTNESF